MQKVTRKEEAIQAEELVKQKFQKEIYDYQCTVESRISKLLNSKKPSLVNKIL